MSSSRIKCHRKRRSDDESSSSDSDVGDMRIKRRCSVPNHSNFQSIVYNKFLDFVDWIYNFPMGHNEDENINENTINCSLEVQLQDEDVKIDDDDSVIEDSDNSDQPSRSNNLKTIPISLIKEKLSSTPFCRVARGRTFNSLSRLPVNGCNNSKAYPTKIKRNNTNHQEVKPILAPLTTFCSEVEILFDGRETPDEESDDLEIVSEISNEKSSRRLTRQTVSSNVSKFDEASSEYNGVSSGSSVNRKTSYEKEKSSNKSFTAHEVIRLQEKAHYQLILDKMSGLYSSPYHPSIPKKNTKPADIEIDLTEDDKAMDDNHMKAENSEIPVDGFLQKYYKPVQFKSPVPPVVDITEKFNKKDNDVQIIESPALYNVEQEIQKMKPEIIYSHEWIEDFKRTVTLKTEERLQTIAAQEDKLERYRKRRNEHILREKIIRGEPISVDQPGKDEFPELTPDMNERIDQAFRVNSLNEILSAFKDCTCTGNDLATLAGLNWLNDSVINFYLALIMERCKSHPEYPLVYCFNSYFYIALKGRGPKAVLRWTRKIEDKKNIFQFDIVFVPLHLGMHWALCVIDNRTKKIKYYDSMQGTDDQSLRIVQNYLVAEKQDKLGITMDPNEYSIEMVKNIPQQMNGSDCGMFTLKYAEYLSRDVPITFSQEHMQYFRRRMMFEILDKKLF